MIADRPPDQRADAQRQPHAFKKRHRGVAAVAEIDEDRRQHRRREDHQQDAGDALYGGKAPAWLVKRHAALGQRGPRSEEHSSELQSLMRISYAVFCLKKKKKVTMRLK